MTLLLPARLVTRLRDMQRARWTGNLTIHFREGEAMAVRAEEVETLRRDVRRDERAPVEPA